MSYLITAILLLLGLGLCGIVIAWFELAGRLEERGFPAIGRAMIWLPLVISLLAAVVVIHEEVEAKLEKAPTVKENQQ